MKRASSPSRKTMRNNCIILFFHRSIAAKLQIKFISAIVRGDIYGMKCDIKIPTTNACDVYVEIKIDGKIVKSYRDDYKTLSSTQAEKRIPMKLAWILTTSEPISKSSKVEISMRDRDEDGDDDRLGEWTLENDQINGRKVSLSSAPLKLSQLTIEAQWL